MPAFFCNSCGLQYAPSESPPRSCPLCDDERHLVSPGGQSWSTIDQIARKSSNMFRQHEPALVGIGSVPPFAIGQRAILVRSPQGNILWDCTSLIDDITIDIVKGLGGLKAIAVSHPHYYSGMVEWSHAFGGVPIHLHVADRLWVMRPDPMISFWDGDTLQLTDELTLIRVGGHFAGGAVAHWAPGSNHKGSLLAGDLVMIAADKKWAAFMRSFPNSIPLSAPAVQRIGKLLDPYPFDAIHGPFFDRLLAPNAKAVLVRSIERYVKHITDDGSLALT
jgi:hypothetical protein